LSAALGALADGLQRILHAWQLHQHRGESLGQWCENGRSLLLYFEQFGKKDG